jgi:hypothetical protein
MVETKIPTALTIQNTIKSIGAEAAEMQLALVGEHVGDAELALVVEELDPNEIALIVGEGDYTKPSIAASFITPRQFIGALEHFGARWGSLEGTNINVLYRLKQQLADFVLSVILHSGVKNHKKLILALAHNRLGRDVLTILPFREHGCPEFLEEFDERAFQKGTWQELFVQMRDVSFDAFTSQQRKVRSLYRKHDEHGISVVADRFLERTMHALVEKALEHVSEDEGSEKKDVFLDI